MPTLTDRLENWARWARDGRPPSTAASFEGRYRSPRGAWYEPGPPAPPLGWDEADALEIESAVCALEILPHTLLRGHYVRAWAPFRVWRAAHAAAPRTDDARYSLRRYAEALDAAHAALDAQLQVPAVIRRARARARVRAALLTPDDQ